MATPKPRQIRVPDDLWEAFDEATFAMGTDRSKALVAFMRRYVAAMSIGRPDSLTQSASVVQATDPGPCPM